MITVLSKSETRQDRKHTQNVTQRPVRVTILVPCRPIMPSHSPDELVYDIYTRQEQLLVLIA